jgi:hypothetical protein
MTPEDQLCLLLARGHLTPDLQQRILEFLASALQWPLVLERAYTHEVYPLLYRNLRELGFPSVPDAVQAELKGAFLANAFRNQLLAEELARLLGLLGKAGIPVIPLKGVTLAQSLYGDTAFRICSDIDILVPPNTVPEALGLIRASGYRDDFREPFFCDLVMRYGRHYDVVREDRALSSRLELHWKFLHNSSRNDEAITDLWAEVRPKAFFGVRAYTFTPEWEFLYLAMHATDHQWMLKWLVDIHEISSFASVAWQMVMKKAEHLELDLVVRQTLTACSLLLGTPMPEGYSPTALPGKVRLFPAAPFPAATLQTALFPVHVLRRPLDKLRCLAKMLLIPCLTDRDFLRLPSSLSFLYYPLRPMRLTCKWSWRLLKLGFANFIRMLGFWRNNAKLQSAPPCMPSKRGRPTDQWPLL